MAKELRFPLYERAERLGILDGKSALIVAPTATGKSHIGREAIRRALERDESGTHTYLVPFRALATEVFESFLDLLTGTQTRVRIVTGDYRDPIRPDQADLIVATYESFVGLLRNSAFRPGIIVADEVHLIADDHRGPVVEGLFARLLASGHARTILGLSAVVENGSEVAEWLGVPLMEGTVSDRPVPLSLEHVWADNVDEALVRVLRPCTQGEQALVFCGSRPGAEKTARLLGEVIKDCLSTEDRDSLSRLADQILEEDPEAEDVASAVASGVAYHHAGLTKPIRRHIEEGFRTRRIRVISGTTTLAAGVNLPAGIAVVKNIFRSDVVRGVFRRVLLPSGEILNMLGRAARPHQVERGSGIALVERKYQGEPEVKELLSALKAGRGGPVASHLLDSFEDVMRFVLGVVVEHGETTRDDIVRAFSKTLAYHSQPLTIDFSRPFEQDMMEDFPAYQKVMESNGEIYLDDYWLSPEGVHAKIVSRDKKYEVSIGVIDISCSCPASSQFYRGRVCKHQACAIHDLLFGKKIKPEAHYRAIYNCGHIFGRTLDVGTRLNQAIEIMAYWRLFERIPSGWRATPAGEVASISGFDLLFVHQAIERVISAGRGTYKEVALWAVEDYFAGEADRKKWLRVIPDWLAEVDLRKIKLPTKYRGDFEQGLEDLARVCLLYEKAALVLAKKPVAEAAKAAAGALRYGVAPEVVPLMALGLTQLARARSRYLYDRGVKDLQDLANADPTTISDPRRTPEVIVRSWVERAKEIYQARTVAVADREEADAEFDELVARFRLDPAALSPG